MNDPGQRPSVYHVAEMAGVSTASVSRFFRSPEKVSESTRQRIADSVERLGYLPSGHARALAERRTGVIGLYSFSAHEPDEVVRHTFGATSQVAPVRELSRPPRLYPLYADETLSGVELECALNGVPLVVGWQLGTNRGVQIDDIARRCDGLIVLPATVGEEHLRRLSARMPIVLVSQPVPVGMAACSVSVDDAAGMAAIANHLIEAHDARTFWYVGPVQGPEHGARLRGLRDALAAGERAEPSAVIATDGWRSSTKEAFGSVLADIDDATSNLPDAIVCDNDQTALGVLETLAEFGISVPDDVAVTGFDGIDAGRHSEPPLTTIRQPMDELGREAVVMLLDALGNGHPRGSRVLPLSVVIRRSCGCA